MNDLRHDFNNPLNVNTCHFWINQKENDTFKYLIHNGKYLWGDTYYYAHNRDADARGIGTERDEGL